MVHAVALLIEATPTNAEGLPPGSPLQTRAVDLVAAFFRLQKSGAKRTLTSVAILVVLLRGENRIAGDGARRVASLQREQSLEPWLKSRLHIRPRPPSGALVDRIEKRPARV